MKYVKEKEKNVGTMEQFKWVDHHRTQIQGHLARTTEQLCVSQEYTVG